MSLALEAKQFLRSTHHGILSTISTKFVGYPFGSATPFVLDHNCQPIIFISSIAEHTKNIIVNPKVSLLVFDKGDDLQANARLTLIGEATQISKDDADLVARYCRYLPQTVNYLAMHDFSFYRINIHQARYIASFGKMNWMDGDELVGSSENSASIAQLEPSMIEHMNTDHVDSMMAYCQNFYGVVPSRVTLIGIDSDGFDIEAMNNDALQILRFNFVTPIFDANSARAAFVAMSKAVHTKPPLHD
jgi:heme iron utilization protein